MVSEIFPVVTLDEYAEKHLSPNSLHLGPSPSIISKRQLPFSSTIVKYTLHSSEIYCKKDIKLFTKSSVKSPDNFIMPEQITWLRRRHCQVFVGRVYKNVCKTTKCNDVIHIP